MDISYRFEPTGNTTVTIFSIDGQAARAGAKATRYFRKLLDGSEPHALKVAGEAFRRSSEARAKWPEWRKPVGLSQHETELTLIAMLLVDGWDEARITEVVRTDGRGF
jgi:hypothetical protein